MKKKHKKIPLSFYQQADVISLGRELLGKYLCTCLGPENVVTGGMITETEAYGGAQDKASHAYGNRRTKRTQTLFSKGGTAYVYLCYGIHHLFNIVTNTCDVPHAILIRAIHPEIGVKTMLQRRKKGKVIPTLTSGPGAVCQALGITRVHNGCVLNEDSIWLEDRGIEIPEENVIASPRIGIDYAQEDASNPWRFTISPN